MNSHRVPAALAESLMSGVNALAAQKPVCLPAIPTATVPSMSEPRDHGHGHGHGRGHDENDQGDGN